MKKFLIFLVAIVVVVCLGVTTFYFVRNDETISFKAKDIYCNVGDIVTLNELGYKVTKKQKNTKYNFNAGGNEVAEFVNYDANKGGYVCNKGGEVEVKLSTTNSGFKNFTFNFHIGDGEAVPYNIENEDDLSKIGTRYGLDKKFALLNDITVPSNFAPIGFIKNGENYTPNNFTGEFDGKGKTIKGLNLTASTYANAGLFYGLENARVHDLVIDSATINGAYSNAGVLTATAIDSDITRIEIKNSNITINSTASATIGSLIGKIENSKVKISYADNSTISANSNGELIVGGLIGNVIDSNIEATYAKSTINSETAGSLGGLVGRLSIDNIASQSGLSFNTKGYIRQSYSKVNDSVNGFIGAIVKSSDFDIANANKLSYLVGNYAVGGNGTLATDNTELYTDGYINELKKCNMITSISDEGIKNTNLIYYIINATKTEYWDNSVWTISAGVYPVLKMVDVNLKNVELSYLNKLNTNLTEINDKNDFVSAFQPANGVVEGKIYSLAEDLDLSEVNWKPVKLINTIIYGENYTISNLTISGNDTNNADCLGMFSVMDNSAVYDLALTNVQLNSTTNENRDYNVGGIVGKMINSSAINNLYLTYRNIVPTKAENFGGIAGQVIASTISESVVENVALDKDKKFYNVGLIAGNNEGTLENNGINRSGNVLYGISYVGGVAGLNAGTITDTGYATVDKTIIKYNNTADIEQSNYANIGGVAGYNKGTILNTIVNVDIEILNSKNGVNVGGITGVNHGSIVDSIACGEQILIGKNVNKDHKYYVGGIAGINSKEITNSSTYVKNVGAFELVENGTNVVADKQIYVGGVTAIIDNNEAQINKCVVSSNLYGNYVSGVVSSIKNGDVKINEILVGNFDTATGAISQNEIKGDKFVAGICYEFRAGNISNVQTCSKIVGASENTISSLMVLYFENAASLKSAIINSKLAGYGKFYRDTWCDYGILKDLQQSNSKVFSYGIYEADSFAGTMQSVVIASDYKTGAINVKKSEFHKIISLFDRIEGITYENTQYSSFVKELNSNDLKNEDNYNNVVLSQEFAWLFGRPNFYADKTMTFDKENNIWESVSGESTALKLVFLKTLMP